MDIVYISNDNYAPYSGISILSLLENNKSVNNLNLHYINNGISKENKNKIEGIVNYYNRNITFYDVDLDNIFNKVGMNRHENEFQYIDLFLHEILPKDMDKVLYLDSDSIICGNISELWDENIDEYYMGAVLEIKLNLDTASHYKRELGINEKDPYINAGVLLINLKKMRNSQISKEFVNYINNVNHVYYDQDTINVVLNGKIKILNLKYNFFPELPKIGYDNVMKWTKNEYYYTKSEYEEALDNIVFLHFQLGIEGRPWFKNTTVPFSEEFDKYAKLSPWSEEEIYTENKSSYKNMLINFIIYKLSFRIFFILLTIIRKIRHLE